MKLSALLTILAFYILTMFGCINGGGSGSTPDSSAGIPRGTYDSTQTISPHTNIDKSRHFNKPFPAIVLKPIKPAIQQPQMGSVAYYCPSKMIVDQEYFITVSIAKEQLSELITEVEKDAQALNPRPK